LFPYTADKEIFGNKAKIKLPADLLYEVTGLEIQLCNNFTYRSQPTQLKIVKPS